jgi:hypothetical protein
MRSIYIAIPDDAADKLRELARREFRAPRQQAAVLVLAGLKNAGLDPDEEQESPVGPSDASPSGPKLASGARVRARQGAHRGDDLPVGA